MTGFARNGAWLLLVLAVGCSLEGDVGPAIVDAAAEAGRDASMDAEASRGSDEPTCDDVDAGVACPADHHCESGRCVLDRCGDALVQGDEGCDDGNEVLGDGCDPACRLEPAGCLDGVQDADEECDDGNRFDLDACSNVCTLNQCGNARIDGQEECDDGNYVDDDACSRACTENRCRNGRLDVGEECDDGNRIHDDGCSNACAIVVCGNARVEGDEECDDGNENDADDCYGTCLSAECGNRRVDPGEMCDGDTVAVACSDDCMGMTVDECRPCETTHCAAYLDVPGYDVVSACIDAGEAGALVRSTFGVPEVDALFVQQCIDVIDCARRSRCGYDPASVAVGCYCGSKSVDECNASGPADDAPCIEEWQAATRGPTNLDVMLRLSDTTYPSGWAYSMLECDLTHCQVECVPSE